MKKIAGCLLLLVLCLCLSGCGKKTLECNRTETGSASFATSTDYALKWDFKSDKVERIEQEIVFNIADDYVDEISTLETSLNSTYQMYQNEGVSVNTWVVGNSIHAKIVYDVPNMSDDVINNFELQEIINKNYDGIKGSMEEAGATCK